MGASSYEHPRMTGQIIAAVRIHSSGIGYITGLQSGDRYHRRISYSGHCRIRTGVLAYGRVDHLDICSRCR